MKCSECKYSLERNAIRTYTVCTLTSEVNPTSKLLCCNDKTQEEIDSMSICAFCEHWIGGGDWGLTCAIDYYKAYSDGFTEACDNFKRREV